MAKRKKTLPIPDPVEADVNDTVASIHGEGELSRKEQRKDVQLHKRAIREGWPVTPEMRQAVVDFNAEVIENAHGNIHEPEFVKLGQKSSELLMKADKQDEESNVTVNVQNNIANLPPLTDEEREAWRREALKD